MIDQIQALPAVKSAMPVVRTFGLMNVSDLGVVGVQVEGYDLSKVASVNAFANGMHLYQERQKIIGLALAGQPLDSDQKDTLNLIDNSADLTPEQQAALADAVMGNKLNDSERTVLQALADSPPTWFKPLPLEDYRQQFPRAKGDVSQWPGMIVGTGVVDIHPDEKGVVHRSPLMYTWWAKLTVLGLSGGGRINPEDQSVRNYWVVDDSHTGVFPIDSNTVYVPFDVLQKDLRMDPQPYTDMRTGEHLFTDARVSEIQISLKNTDSVDAVKMDVQKIVNSIAGNSADFDEIRVQSWEERNAQTIGAVEHERSLLVILFAIISVVAVFLIFCIFFMIVVEKTRDIGIIKSVGATSMGVASIFLGYGLTIGIVGSGLGLLFGYLVVHNINSLNAWLGRVWHTRIWDPRTYVFDTIPNQIDTKEAVVIVAAAILASLIGALVPAIRAARMNPVEALRWE
jgi:lipoprotein-releasing system permease protein